MLFNSFLKEGDFWFRELRSQNFCWLLGDGCWMASFASISDGFVNFVRRPSVCAQPPFIKLRSQNFWWMRGVGCWMASFASISDGFVNFVRRPSVCAQPPKRKQSFVNKFTLKLAHNKLFLYWWVLFFRSFALMQKNQKIKSGNPQLKNDIFF